jgi:hypothetical protein
MSNELNAWKLSDNNFVFHLFGLWQGLEVVTYCIYPLYLCKYCIILHLTIGWKHGILYKKCWWKNIKFKKRYFFMKIEESIQFLLTFHFETMVLSVGLVLNWIRNLEKFGIIKVGNKYFWIWLANMVFKSTFSL